MNRKTMFASAVALVIGGACANAFAAPPATPSSTATTQAVDTKQTAHASLRLDVGRAKAWVGESLPITLRAYFRGAEGVTLEGTPQLTSTGVFTSELGREPRQSNEIIGGESVLVATWTGTVTPSSPAPIKITAELPIRLRYRDPAPQVEVSDPFGGDPFGDLANSPFDTSMMDRFFRQSMRQSLGRAHEEAVSLRASTGSIDVQALPTVDQPASFSGAIGHFDIDASVSSNRAHVSEPITLRIAVAGDGDLDRVDLGGVATSDAWKAYPPKSIIEPAAKGKRARKIFDQVLVPLRGGSVSVPAVSFAAFDPDANRYVVRETTPLAITVDGTAIAADSQPTAVSAVATVAAEPVDETPPVMPAQVRAMKIVWWLAPLALLVAALALASRLGRKRAERSLRRTMRSAASKGEAVSFYRAAHALIEARLSKRWGVSRENVNVPVIRERLGANGDALAQVLLTDEALRFGRGHLETANLVPLCSSIERSLGGAS